jgi:uncharacterized protein (DUF736 family)
MGEKNPDELGALWEKSGAKGPYMTGTVNGEAVVVFRNDRKTGNQPDWRVMKSKPRPTKTSSDEVGY